MSEYTIPKHGSLGLLALGHEGLDRWRAARGDGWRESRRRDVEQARAERETDPDLSALTVVVVTGLPRSGTSMAMQMLDAGGLSAFTDGQRPADTSNQKGYYEHERVKATSTDQSWLPDADRHAVKVVAPLPVHLPKGPRYHVLWMERDIEAVLASQSAMLGRSERAAADASVLRPAYGRFLKATSRWAEGTPRVSLTRLNFDDVLRDPTTAADRLTRAVSEDFDLDTTAMAAVVDPSLRREQAGGTPPDA